jgi:hypothetical protein
MINNVRLGVTSQFWPVVSAAAHAPGPSAAVLLSLGGNAREAAGIALLERPRAPPMRLPWFVAAGRFSYPPTGLTRLSPLGAALSQCFVVLAFTANKGGMSWQFFVRDEGCSPSSRFSLP